MESVGEMETALQFYESAQDNLSLVRVYCYCGNLEKVIFIIPVPLCSVVTVFRRVRGLLKASFGRTKMSVKYSFPKINENNE